MRVIFVEVTSDEGPPLEGINGALISVHLYTCLMNLCYLSNIITIFGVAFGFIFIFMVILIFDGGGAQHIKTVSQYKL